MGDSVQIVNNANVKRIHSTKPSGKLHKGHNITAASSSIPSKYQTVVIDNSERKGFLSKSQRFQYDFTANDHPGPGNYVGHKTMDLHKSSYSKKGTGGFASKDKRIQRLKPDCSPGPVYALPSMLTTQKDYNRSAATRAFQQPIAKELQPKSTNMPAPNTYDVLQSKKGKQNNVTADAAFKSRSRREMINLAEAKGKPAPWQYNVKDTLTKDGVKVPYSSFKSRSVRQMAAAPPEVPGPGAYKPFEEVEPVSKTVFPKKHYLCISAPAMPLPSTPPLPGPGAYEVRDYEGQPKHYMSGSVFVSSTSRWAGNHKMMDMPGPAHYRPSDVGKQSFIYNAAQKWVA